MTPSSSLISIFLLEDLGAKGVVKIHEAYKKLIKMLDQHTPLADTAAGLLRVFWSKSQKSGKRVTVLG